MRTFMFTGVATTPRGLAHFELITDMDGPCTRETIEAMRLKIQEETQATGKPGFTCIIELNK